MCQQGPLTKAKRVLTQESMFRSIDKTHNLFSISRLLLLRILWIKIGLILIAFAVAFASVMSLLIITWRRDDYSHGFLIPFISIYLVWLKRMELKSIPIQPNIIMGTLIMFFSSLIYILGRMGSVVLVQTSSIIVMIPGMILMLLGKDYLKSLVFPLSYLVLMVPVFDIFMYEFHWPFQLISATLGAGLLTLFHIPVFQNLQYLELPNITLEVAESCSGVHFIVSIIAVGIPLAYFTQKEWWRRLGLILIAIVISILANSLRVALIGVWTYNGGEVVHGPLHIFQGLFVSVVGFSFLFVLAWVFANNPNSTQESLRRKEMAAMDSRYIDAKRFNRGFLVTVALLFALSSYIYLHKLQPVPLKRDLKGFPLKFGKWQGNDVVFRLKDKPFRVEGADSEITRLYRDNSNREIILYVAYFESQRQNKELIHHKLYRFYEYEEKVEIPAGIKGSVRINRTVLRDGTQLNLVLFYYTLNGRIVANRYKAKFMTALDGLIHGRTNGAVVIVFSRLSRLDELNEVQNHEIEFIRETFPVFKDRLLCEYENGNRHAGR